MPRSMRLVHARANATFSCWSRSEGVPQPPSTAMSVVTPMHRAATRHQRGRRTAGHRTACPPARYIVSNLGSMSDPAGWYPDPTTRHELRYWDGYVWLDNVSDKGAAGTDPL